MNVNDKKFKYVFLSKMAIIAQSSLSMFTVFYCLHEKQSGTFFLSKSSETKLFMITYFNLLKFDNFNEEEEGDISDALFSWRQALFNMQI